MASFLYQILDTSNGTIYGRRTKYWSPVLIIRLIWPRVYIMVCYTSIIVIRYIIHSHKERLVLGISIVLVLVGASKPFVKYSHGFFGVEGFIVVGFLMLPVVLVHTQVVRRFLMVSEFTLLILFNHRVTVGTDVGWFRCRSDTPLFRMS
uniref:Uncharacterized protein n=1 Tax=Cacopsylla melanoneura TaxID=428564 RepID=A0A8D8RUJ2_9HEMI